jgi:hypothetical protein
MSMRLQHGAPRPATWRGRDGVLSRTERRRPGNHHSHVGAWIPNQLRTNTGSLRESRFLESLEVDSDGDWLRAKGGSRERRAHGLDSEPVERPCLVTGLVFKTSGAARERRSGGSIPLLYRLSVFCYPRVEQSVG